MTASTEHPIMSQAEAVALGFAGFNDVPHKPIDVPDVPVSAPCMGEKPDEVVALNQKLDQAHWKQLGTDQREALIGAHGVARKVYGDKLAVASAGCP